MFLSVHNIRDGKKHYKIQLTKNKMNLYIWKRKKPPLSPTQTQIPVIYNKTMNNLSKNLNPK